MEQPWDTYPYIHAKDFPDSGPARMRTRPIWITFCLCRGAADS